MTTNKFLDTAFGDIFQTMGITMADIEEEIYDLDLPRLDHDMEFQLKHDGLIIDDGLKSPDITFSSPNQFFLFRQRPVLVYIRDQFLQEDKFWARKFNPFHICFCDALQAAQKEQRLKNRYVVTYNTTGRFLVNLTVRGMDFSGNVRVLEKLENQYEELHVCQNCLRQLNWNHFRDHCFGESWWMGPGAKKRMDIVNQFSIRDFFLSVKSDLRTHKEFYGASMAPRKEYVLTPEEKQALKRRAGHRCEECGKSLPDNELYIHHVDHNEGNNNTSNLKVVCLPCHKSIHRMEGGYILDD